LRQKEKGMNPMDSSLDKCWRPRYDRVIGKRDKGKEIIELRGIFRLRSPQRLFEQTVTGVKVRC